LKFPVILSVLVVTFLLSCSSASPAPAEPTPKIDATVQAKVSATLSASKPQTPSTTQAICKLTGGETVQSGWTGEDTGSNFCNSCFCTNGVLGCTKMGCRVNTSTLVPRDTPKPKPTPTRVRPTWTPVIPTPSPTITYTPRVSSNFIALEDLNSNISEVPKIAWEDSQAILTENGVASQDAVELEIKVGPTTDLYFSDNEAALKTAIQFWSGFDQPSRYIALFYNFDDLGWAEEELMSSGLGLSQESAKRRVQATCTDTICSGANSGLGYGDFPSVGIGTFGIHGPDSGGKYRHGPLHIHEYTHSVQPAPWIGLSDHPQNGANENAPCWLIEGNAHFTGYSAGITNYEDYLDLRSREARGRHYDEQFNDYSTPKILEHYDNSTSPACIGRSDYALGYSVGLLSVEALSAIAGSNSSMYLYKYMSHGITFEEAFEIIYGSPWEEAKPVLAAFVSSSIERSFDN